MNTIEVASRLVQLCREGKNLDAINELYSEDIKSSEPQGSEFEPTKGIAAVRNKYIEWEETVTEVNKTLISDPIVSGNFFSCTMDYEITYKEHGRLTFNEVCVYETYEGKIITEQFFYHMQG